MLSISKQRGVTLIELIVGITIISILFMLAAPSYRTWVQNQQVRAGAESILNGLRLARSSAVSINGTARFVLCDVNNQTTSWEVLAASATAAAPTASFACAGASPGSNAAAGDTRVQERSGQEGSKFAKISTVVPNGATTVTFNSLGRVMNLNADSTLPLTQINVTNPGGDRPLQINIANPGGNTRMCDPSPLLAASDPRHC